MANQTVKNGFNDAAFTCDIPVGLSYCNEVGSSQDTVNKVEGVSSLALSSDPGAELSFLAPTTFFPDGSNQGSIDVYVRPLWSGAPATAQFPLSFNSSFGLGACGLDAGPNYVRISHYTDGLLECLIEDKFQASIGDTSFTWLPISGTWYRLRVVWDVETEGYLRFYVDELLKSETTGLFGDRSEVAGEPTDSLIIGRPFYGNIDALNMYDYEVPPGVVANTFGYPFGVRGYTR